MHALWHGGGVKELLPPLIAAVLPGLIHQIGEWLRGRRKPVDVEPRVAALETRCAALEAEIAKLRTPVDTSPRRHGVDVVTDRERAIAFAIVVAVMVGFVLLTAAAERNHGG